MTIINNYDYSKYLWLSKYSWLFEIIMAIRNNDYIQNIWLFEIIMAIRNNDYIQNIWLFEIMTIRSMTIEIFMTIRNNYDYSKYSWLFEIIMTIRNSKSHLMYFEYS